MTKKKNSPAKGSSESAVSVQSLLQEIENLKIRIGDIEQKFNTLESENIRLESEIAVTKKVNSILEEQVDSLQQYQRRSCMIIDGIQPVKKGTKEDMLQLKSKIKKIVTTKLDISNASFEDNFDKCHRIGPVKNGKQSSIIRFRTHSFRENLYMSRKNLDTDNIRFRVSLTSKRIELLKQANETIKESKNNVFKFAYADISGNLRVLLSKAIDNRWSYPFTNTNEFNDLIRRLADKAIMSDEEVDEASFS